MLRNLLLKLKDLKLTEKLIKMSEASKEGDIFKASQKRPASDDPDMSKKKKKKKKGQPVTLAPSENAVRKIALLAAYNGSGYYGVQIQSGSKLPTIEQELFPALLKAGAITESHVENPSQMWFQRGSRTDKGVSACGQTFSLKAKLVPDLVQKINENLPPQIRIVGYIQTTKGFDSKNFCDARTYMYMMPTFALCPLEKLTTEEFRADSKVIERTREILNKFVGTHKYHNFTSGVKFTQGCAQRYIMKFECSEPYIRDGLEFITLRIKGQSFMLHQIRKMVGLTIAIVRGQCGELALDRSWGPEQVDVPKAPGLGLVLEELHFGGYNKKFGRDGIHEPIDWTQFKESVEKFKEEHIIAEIVAKEKEEKSMFNWLQTLQFHNYDQTREEGPQKPWAYFQREFKKLEPGKYVADKNIPPSETNTETNTAELLPVEEKKDSSGDRDLSVETNNCVKIEQSEEKVHDVDTTQSEEKTLDSLDKSIESVTASIDNKEIEALQK